MQVRVEIDEKRLRELVHTEMQRLLGTAAPSDPKDISIQVKSKANWKAEWEPAAFRAVYEKTT